MQGVAGFPDGEVGDDEGLLGPIRDLEDKPVISIFRDVRKRWSIDIGELEFIEGNSSAFGSIDGADPVLGEVEPHGAGEGGEGRVGDPMVNLIDSLLSRFGIELRLDWNDMSIMDDSIAILDDEVSLTSFMGMEGPVGSGGVARGGQYVLVIAIDSNGSARIIRDGKDDWVRGIVGQGHSDREIAEVSRGRDGDAPADVR